MYYICVYVYVCFYLTYMVAAGNSLTLMVSSFGSGRLMSSLMKKEMVTCPPPFTTASLKDINTGLVMAIVFSTKQTSQPYKHLS